MCVATLLKLTHSRFSIAFIAVTCRNFVTSGSTVWIWMHESTNQAPSPQSRFPVMDLQHSPSLALIVHSDRLMFVHHFLMLSFHLCRWRSLAHQTSTFPLQYNLHNSVESVNVVKIFSLVFLSSAFFSFTSFQYLCIIWVHARDELHNMDVPISILSFWPVATFDKLRRSLHERGHYHVAAPRSARHVAIVHFSISSDIFGHANGSYWCCCCCECL